MKSYATVGTIKSIDLSNRTFKLDPISKYRFEVKDGDENSWKIVFADESCSDPDNLKLVVKDTDFAFKEGLESSMIVLKQGRGKVKVVIVETHLTDPMQLANAKGDANRAMPENTGSTGGNEESQKTGENKYVKPVNIEVL